MPANRHCAFGNCNSDSREGRPGFSSSTRFFKFPKPCLEFRKSSVSRYHPSRSLNVVSESDSQTFVKRHLAECAACQLCQKWVKKCKRGDGKFKNICDVSRNTFVCSEHFPSDIAEIDYAVHVPVESVETRLITRHVATTTPEPDQTSSILDAFEGVSTPNEGELVGAEFVVVDGVVNKDQETQTSFAAYDKSSQTDLVFYDMKVLKEENMKLKSEVRRLKEEVDSRIITKKNHWTHSFAKRKRMMTCVFSCFGLPFLIRSLCDRIERKGDHED